jgi:hypothetical protein
MKRKNYPYDEGDVYFTIENGVIYLSIWDNISEEIHDENPYQNYYSNLDEVLHLSKTLNTGGFLWYIISAVQGRWLLFSKQREVYRLYNDGSESLCTTREDFDNEDAIYAIELPSKELREELNILI